MFGTPCGAAKDKDGMDTRPWGNVMVSLDIIRAEDRSRVKKSCGPPCNPAMSKLPAPNWLCMLQSDPKISSRELQWWDHIVQETMRTTTPGWPAVGRDKFEFASSRTSAGSETLRAAGNYYASWRTSGSQQERSHWATGASCRTCQTLHFAATLQHSLFW